MSSAGTGAGAVAWFKKEGRSSPALMCIYLVRTHIGFAGLLEFLLSVGKYQRLMVTIAIIALIVSVAAAPHAVAW